MVQALLSIVLTAAAVMVVTKVFPGIRCKDFATALKVSLGISVLSFVAFKILALITLPFIILTGFLGYFIISAAVLWLVDEMVDDFEVRGMKELLLGSVGISVISTVLGWVVGRVF